MSKKIQDENGNTFVEVKPLYKRWWIWVLAVVVVIIAIAALSGGKDDTSSNKNSTANGHSTTDVEKGNSKNDNSSSNYLTIDYAKVPIISEKDYKLSITDNSWNSAAISVSNARIVKVEPFEYDSQSGKKAQGLVILHVSVKPSRDLDSAYPDQSTLITSDGQQVDAIIPSIKGLTLNWGGEIANGVDKSGDVVFPIEKLSTVSDIKSLRYKFSASYDTDDYDDENYNHDYDMTINLNN